MPLFMQQSAESLPPGPFFFSFSFSLSPADGGFAVHSQLVDTHACAQLEAVRQVLSSFDTHHRARLCCLEPHALPPRRGRCQIDPTVNAAACDCSSLFRCLCSMWSVCQGQHSCSEFGPRASVCRPPSAALSTARRGQGVDALFACDFDALKPESP